jgi:hypothetical protein
MIPLMAATGVAGGGTGVVVVGAGGVLGTVTLGAGGMVTTGVLVVVVGTRTGSAERVWLTEATSDSPAPGVLGAVPPWSTPTTRKMASPRASRHPKGSQPGFSASAPAA